MNRRNERGFTLIELLVASTAGLFVVLAAFMLSRGATRLFASEGRVGNSQLNLRLGVDRLRQDIERASFLGTANMKTDPDVCPDPQTLGFSARLQGLYLQQGTAATSTVETPLSAQNGLNPDKLTVTGNFVTTDSYVIRSVEPSSAGGYDIRLQVTDAVMRMLSGGETSSPLAQLQAVFAKDRIVRVRNELGSSQFGVVQNASIGADNVAIINVAPNPPLQVTSGATVVKRCAISGPCRGCELSPLQIVKYEVKSLATDARFAWAYTSGGVVDKDKYDLVRTELKADGTPVTDSEEIVAEYAVDLAFAFAVDRSLPITPGSTSFYEPEIVQLAFGHPDNAKWGGDILTNDPTVRPQRIRSVRYRLTTRTRFGDYTVATDDAGAGLGRYKLGPDRFARAKTITGEVALINQRGIAW